MKKFTLLTVATLSILAVTFGAFAHDVAVTAGGLGGSNFKLELQFLGADPSLAFVQDSTPNLEQVYRAKFSFNMNGANGTSFRNGSAFIYLFQAFGSGHFISAGNCGPSGVGPVIRAGVQKVGSQYAIRVYSFDNQCNRRSPLPGCIISDLSADVDVQIQWEAGNGLPNNFSVQMFENGIETCNSATTVQNGFLRITDQALLTLPDAATPVQNDHTVFVDNFESFRTLAP